MLIVDRPLPQLIFLFLCQDSMFVVSSAALAVAVAVAVLFSAYEFYVCFSWLVKC